MEVFFTLKSQGQCRDYPRGLIQSDMSENDSPQAITTRQENLKQELKKRLRLTVQKYPSKSAKSSGVLPLQQGKVYSKEDLLFSSLAEKQILLLLWFCIYLET